MVPRLLTEAPGRRECRVEALRGLQEQAAVLRHAPWCAREPPGPAAPLSAWLPALTLPHLHLLALLTCEPSPLQPRRRRQQAALVPAVLTEAPGLRQPCGQEEGELGRLSQGSGGADDARHRYVSLTPHPFPVFCQSLFPHASPCHPRILRRNRWCFSAYLPVLWLVRTCALAPLSPFPPSHLF
jgi:hypothetical protein